MSRSFSSYCFWWLLASPSFFFLYLCHAVHVYLRCIIAVCVLLCFPSLDTILVDQDYTMIPLLKLKAYPVALTYIFKNKSPWFNFRCPIDIPLCIFSDCILFAFPWRVACKAHYYSSEVIASPLVRLKPRLILSYVTVLQFVSFLVHNLDCCDTC